MDFVISNTNDNKKGVYILDNKEGYYQLASNINFAFGNLIDVLKDSFPEIANMSIEEHAAYSAIRTINNVQGKKIKKKKTKKIYGLTVNEDEAFDIISLTRQKYKELKGRKHPIPIIDMTIQEVYEWYLKFRSHNPKWILPLESVHNNVVDFSKGLKIFSVKTLYDVVYGLFYFYAFNKLKQTECSHCGRWFATNSLKNEYCDRKSPFNYNDIFNLSKREPLECKRAVKYIRQQCAITKKRIYDKANMAKDNSARSNKAAKDFICVNGEYDRKIIELYDKQKVYPTVKNLSEYYHFLQETEKNGEWIQGRANNG